MSGPLLLDAFGRRIERLPPRAKSKKPLSEAQSVLAESLGVIIAELREEWREESRKELERIASEARAVIAEVKAACAEALLEKHAPEAAARLKAIAGGRQ